MDSPYDFWMGLIVGTLIGAAFAFPSGVILARWQRFYQIRDDALRIIQMIDFVNEGGRVAFIRSPEVEKLTLLAGDFFRIRQSAAGEKLGMINQEIINYLYVTPAARSDYTAFERSYAEWQHTLRNLTGDAWGYLQMRSGT